MKGMILAAGLGRRLFPLTRLCPKPAIPFLNRPLIGYTLDLFQQAGIRDVVINLHHLPDRVETAVGLQTDAQKDWNIVFSHEKEILGTAGALSKAREFLTDTFVLCNGKIYFEEDLRPIFSFHEKSKALATLVLVPYTEGDPFNPVFLDHEHKVTSFGRPRNDSDSPYVFTGVHILEAGILQFIPPEPSDIVTDVYRRLLEKAIPITGYVSQAYWCECSTPERYLAKSLEVLRNRGLDNLLESDLNVSCRKVIAGDSVHVQGGSSLSKSVLFDRVRIGRNSSLENVIIAGDVELESDTHLRNAIVTPVLETTKSDEQRNRWLIDDCCIWAL